MNQIIHAAVRRDLARTEAALRSLSDGDADRAVGLQRAWAALWGQLRHHHEQEDEHVWPYVRTLAVVDPAVVDAMESEHHAMAAACEAATAAIDTVAADPTATHAAAAADAVAEAARITDAHLEHEERAITPVIQERMETPEWKAIEAEFRKGRPRPGRAVPRVAAGRRGPRGAGGSAVHDPAAGPVHPQPRFRSVVSPQRRSRLEVTGSP